MKKFARRSAEILPDLDRAAPACDPVEHRSGIRPGQDPEAGRTPPRQATRVLRGAPRVALLALAALGGAACSPGEEPVVDPNANRTQTLAENFRDFGDYVIHFNALPTDQLAPEVARTYDIVRSKNKAMLNIAIIRKREGTLGDSVPGRVQARATNLTGQLKTVELRKLVEGDAIYYIAEIPVANGETLIFDVDVWPENETASFSFRFKQTFYAS